ncbi:hypothetical protein KKH42_02450 [bacterium]|nr:hypothetical protein [bacterium]
MKEIIRKTLAYIIIPGIALYFAFNMGVEAYRFYFCNDGGIKFIKTHPILLLIPFILLSVTGSMLWVSQVCSKKTIRYLELIFKSLFATGVSVGFIFLISITSTAYFKCGGQFSLNEIGLLLLMILISVLCWYDVYEAIKK